MQAIVSSQAIIEAALRVRSMRAVVLAENVANADTPGFIHRDLDFDRTLEVLLSRAAEPSRDSRALLSQENLRADGNDIDLNQEMGRLYRNSMSYVAALRLYRQIERRLQMAMGEA